MLHPTNDLCESLGELMRVKSEGKGRRNAKEASLQQTATAQSAEEEEEEEK